ncbi:DNA-binding response OmpR family regulator [Paenochrobactrum gallinarii]|uniref:DNA-binding response OmpR family regulator n=1 Tax=Paenochrobactrum gallinarii TaxID=643673 RepID=A0A841LXH7_9HYPH|nr:response regulator [Paenochrobactrum gallinarii]MBB6261207.1 DNA-binding response OmpR family regulator [Paenochrobactrum gallinarii]
MPNTLQNLNILIVEDEVITAMDVAATVEYAGGTVLGPCNSVQDALDLIEHNTIHAAILDVNLRDGDVWPLLERLRAHGIFVIVYSSAGLPKEMTKRHPGLSFFHKPMPHAVLARALINAF